MNTRYELALKRLELKGRAASTTIADIGAYVPRSPSTAFAQARVRRRGRLPEGWPQAVKIRLWRPVASKLQTSE